MEIQLKNPMASTTVVIDGDSKLTLDYKDLKFDKAINNSDRHEP